MLAYFHEPHQISVIFFVLFCINKVLALSLNDFIWINMRYSINSISFTYTAISWYIYSNLVEDLRLRLNSNLPQITQTILSNFSDLQTCISEIIRNDTADNENGISKRTFGADIHCKIHLRTPELIQDHPRLHPWIVLYCSAAANFKPSKDETLMLIAKMANSWGCVLL